MAERIHPQATRFRGRKIRTLVLAFLVSSFLSSAIAIDLTTKDGKTYKDATVSRVEPDGIVIISKTGIIKLYFKELPKELQEKYGYDAAKAEAYTAAEAEKQRRLQEMNAARSGPSPPPVSSPSAAPPSDKAVPPARDDNSQRTTGVVLDSHWETSIFAGGSATRKDLARLLSLFAKPNRNLGPSPILEIYQGVTYLMPLRMAAQKLGVAGKLSSKTEVTCPGFPRSSIFSYAVDGTFDGDYNRMLIVTDRADQVLSIALMAEHPAYSRMDSYHNWIHGDSDWSCYNFIVHRLKTVATLRINHELSYQVRDHWIRPREGEPINADLVRADLSLTSHTDRPPRGTDQWDKVLESSRWYVPKPLAELLLYCLNRAGG